MREATKPSPILLREPEVRKIVPLGRTQRAEAIARGEFPKPVKLTASGRAVAWLEEEIIAYVAARVAARDEEGA
jgi:prophage regulatory protein